MGRGYRAIARNGRVLLATDQPLPELAQRTVWIRVQVWHRAILAGERAEPYGVLLVVRSRVFADEPIYKTGLVRVPGPGCALAIAVGGGMVLEFQE